MARFRLLLVDTGIIIELFRLGLWERFLDQCEVHLSEVILGEALYYEDVNGDLQPIDLTVYRPRLIVHDVPASQLTTLRSQLGNTLLERMDAGEAELLCVLDNAAEAYQICSADAVVFRYLGATYRSSQGLSLEEILKSIGLIRKMDWPFTQRFREQYSRVGFAQGITGQATR